MTHRIEETQVFYHHQMIQDYAEHQGWLVAIGGGRLSVWTTREGRICFDSTTVSCDEMDLSDASAVDFFVNEVKSLDQRMEEEPITEEDVSEASTLSDRQVRQRQQHHQDEQRTNLTIVIGYSKERPRINVGTTCVKVFKLVFGSTSKAHIKTKFFTEQGKSNKNYSWLAVPTIMNHEHTTVKGLKLCLDVRSQEPFKMFYSVRGMDEEAPPFDSVYSKTKTGTPLQIITKMSLEELLRQSKGHVSNTRRIIQGIGSNDNVLKLLTIPTEFTSSQQ